MKRQGPTGNNYDFWKAGKIRFENGEYYRHESRFKKPIKVILSKSEVVQITTKQKQVFAKECCDKITPLKNKLLQKFESNSNIFHLVAEEQLAFHNLLKSFPGEVLPSTDSGKMNFGSFRFPKSKVIAIRHYAALSENLRDYNKYHPKRRKTFFIPEDDNQIEAQVYSDYFECVDSINSLLQSAVKQINTTISKRYDKNIPVISNLKCLKIYFENNLSRNFNEIILDLNKIEGVKLSHDFACKLQLDFLDNFLCASLDEYESHVFQHPDQDSARILEGYYKSLYQVLELCYKQTRTFKTKVGYENSVIDNTKTIALLKKHINNLEENHCPNTNCNLWRGKKFHKWELNLLTEFADMDLLLNNSNNTYPLGFFTGVQSSSADFRMEMFEQYKMYYPAFFQDWITDSSCDLKCEEYFINYTLEQINNTYLNFSVADSVVIYHASELKDFCFTLAYYNNYVIPLFENIKQFLEGRLKTITYKYKPTVKTPDKASVEIIKPPLTYFITNKNNLPAVDFNNKLSAMHDILTTKKVMRKSCIDPSIDKESFIDAIINNKPSSIKWLWGKQDFRYLSFIASRYYEGSHNSFLESGSNIFYYGDKQKFNPIELVHNNGKLHPDKLKHLDSAFKSLK